MIALWQDIICDGPILWQSKPLHVTALFRDPFVRPALHIGGVFSICSDTAVHAMRHGRVQDVLLGMVVHMLFAEAESGFGMAETRGFFHA
jgi:hypothetical protein